MTDRAVDSHAAALLQSGYTVVRQSHPPETIALLRARILDLYRQHGSPTPFSSEGELLTPHVHLAPTGFVVTGLLGLLPELADHLFSAAVVEIARRALGRDMHLELTGAVLCDETRPFFSWHNHIGGIDVEDYRARNDYPRFTEPERLITVLYLDDISEASGELRVYPRTIDAPTEPPFDPMNHDWSGSIPLHFRAGSTVMLEQCCWHAVMPKTTPGPRVFIGAYLTSAHAPTTQHRDRSLDHLEGAGPLLSSLLQSRR